MNDDLISKRALLEDFRNTITEQSDTYDWLNIINRQPIAYDIEWVINEIKNAGGCDGLNEYDKGWDDAITEAIRIIEKGTKDGYREAKAAGQQDDTANDMTKRKSIRVYISGPVSGIYDYAERFRSAENKLAEQGYIVINPVKVLAMLPDDFAYEEYMNICMDLLTACDAICLLDGWESSLGANREYGYAFARNMQIMKRREGV